MAIYIDKELCKSCKICISLCPKDVFEITTHVNKKGYNYAAAVRQDDWTIRVDELLPDARFLPALAQAFGTGTYLLPQEPYAMCKWLTEPPAGWENIYLAFDFG